jgi:lysophospholipase L1-like esterase
MATLSADGTVTLTLFSGRIYTLAAGGDFGGGSLAANFLLDDDTPVPVPGFPIIAPESIAFPTGATRLRLTLSGSTDPAITYAVTLSTGNTPSSIGAETPAGVDAQIAASLPPTEINPGPITSWAAAGDSITASSIPAATYNSPMWHWIASHSSGKEVPWIQRVSNGGLAFAAGGHRVSDLNATHLPAILALDEKPSHVICQFGTNDTSRTTSPLISVLDYIEGYRTAINTARAAGVEIIIITAPQAQPYNSLADLNTATRAGQIAATNDALYELCDEMRVRLIDCRFLDNPTAPGETYRGVLLEGDLLGIHPLNSWHAAVGQEVAKVLRKYGVGPDIFAHTAVNAEPNFETTIPSFTAGRNLTCTGSLVNRPDAAGGKLLRVAVENNNTKQIGTGDTGILFTPVTGRAVADFEVSVATENGFAPAGGVPAVAVTPILGTSRRLIVIKPARPVTTFTSTVQQVIDALNAHPDVAALVTASGTGTPGSEVFPTASSEMTIPLSNFTTPDPGSPTAAENLMADTDLVRGIMEIWLPAGATAPSLRLSGRATYGAGVFGTIATYQNTTTLSHACPRAGKMIFATPWVTVGTYRRLQVQCYFGGAEGHYDFGRVRVQRKPAP